MSPSTCTEPGDKPPVYSDHHAQEVSVMLVVDLSLARVVQHSPFPGTDPKNLHERWLTGWLPIVNHTGTKGVAG